MSAHQSSDSAPPPSPGRPTASDMAFLGFLGCVFMAVVALGALNFREGLKTEEGKAKAEALLEWLADSKQRRGQADFEPSACASAPTDAGQARTWAECATALFVNGGPLAGARNAFSGESLGFVGRCVPGDPKSPGQFVVEKISATPPGSAVSQIIGPMGADEALDKTQTVKLTVCDKGGYPIKIGEAEF